MCVHQYNSYAHEKPHVIVTQKQGVLFSYFGQNKVSSQHEIFSIVNSQVIM